MEEGLLVRIGNRFVLVLKSSTSNRFAFLGDLPDVKPMFSCDSNAQPTEDGAIPKAV